MTFQARIAKLERARPAQQPADPLVLDMAPDLEARITAAIQAGTCPQSLSDDDLQLLIGAADTAEGQL